LWPGSRPFANYDVLRALVRKAKRESLYPRANECTDQMQYKI